jgi:signal transduction histidine kinase
MAKKEKYKSNKKWFTWSLKNTIMSNIMIVMVLTTAVIMGGCYAASIDILKSMQRDLPSDFFGSMQFFSEAQSVQEFTTKLPTLKSYINSVVQDNYSIREVYVTDQNRRVIYSSLPIEAKYRYETESPASFKIISAPTYIASNFRTIFIEKTYNTVVHGKIVPKTFYIYLSIPKEETTYLTRILQISKWLCSAMMFICLFVVYFLARSISNPLSIMEQTISKIAKGDLSGRLEYTKYEEINKLVLAYNMMANALQRLYSSLEAQVQDRTHKLKDAYAELQNTQAMMVHSEKMKSLGELVAGIMHEINNPINFIYGNMTHLSNYSNDLIQIIDKYAGYETSLKPEEKEDVNQLKTDIDYEFLKSDLPDLIRSCKEGAERAKNIIQDLKSFSRMEEASITDVDLAHEIDLTLNILHNKIKNKAEVHKEYPEVIPKIEAFGGQLNQVFMNILDNAVGAIENTGDIWIRIKEDTEKKHVIIEFEDNGMGMDEETIRKVFNPFFTTKPVGQGTGLGMSITYKIIKNHQGDIRVESKENVGTKFIIELPINIDRENLNNVSGESNE